MDFASPQWLWWLGAAPLGALLAMLCWQRRLRATAAWAARGLWDRLLPTYHPRRMILWSLLLATVLAAATLALARPRWGASETHVERRGVDIVFVLDTSLSMATRDVSPSRLWVAQTLIRRLVRELAGNRFGLVQAEGDGVVMVPLTADGAVIDLLLDAVLPGSLPKPGTQLRPALERALALFPTDSGKHQVMIVLSDGEDHGSGLDSIGDRLASAGVVAHCIGVGTLSGMPLELPGSEPGAAVEYKRDQDGQIVVSRLIEESLRTVSRDSGGIYLRASGPATDHDPLIARIREMDSRSYGSEWLNTQEERHQWATAVAMGALTLLLGLSPFSRSKDEPSQRHRPRLSRPEVTRP